MTNNQPPEWKYHPVRYWRQDQPTGLQNFGDYLTTLFLDDLLVIPATSADAFHLIGSVISDNKIRATLTELSIDPEHGQVAYWGCGARDSTPLAQWTLDRSTFFGVRGPLTRDLLGLPSDTPLGDPALLLPLLLPSPSAYHGQTICVTHFHEQRDPSDIKLHTGVDQVISAAIMPNRDRLRNLISMIAGASFVLSGALHGAIVAAAYNVPFAYFDSGYVNLPFKWHDFAASVGIAGTFATNLREGHSIYRDETRPNFRPLPLVPILHNCPFYVVPHFVAQAHRNDCLQQGDSYYNTCTEPSKLWTQQEVLLEA